MSADEGFKNGTENRFIFPDEEIYQREIGEKIRIPLDLQITHTVDDGKPYAIDEPPGSSGVAQGKD